MKNILKPSEVLKKLPLSDILRNKIKKDRREIEEIISGKDKRKILIIGPCSAWPEAAVLVYAKELKKVEKEVKDKIKIILRLYSQKPRTTIGWSGPLFQPNPFKKPDLEKGILYVREMALKVLEIGLPISDEALFLESGPYLNDLYSYVALGARSSEDHAHRVYVSNLPFAVGVKNPTSGDLKTAFNSILATQSKHSFLGLSGDDFCQINSKGNKFSHLILRGGNNGPNYQKEFLKESWGVLNNLVQNPSVVVDLSHSNSGKNPQKQPEILREILKYLEDNEKLNLFVKGFMVESFLKNGAQDLDKLNFKTCNFSGLSVTDPCLGFEESKKMIKYLYQKLKNEK